jgi:hypothetical protein
MSPEVSEIVLSGRPDWQYSPSPIPEDRTCILQPVHLMSEQLLDMNLYTSASISQPWTVLDLDRDDPARLHRIGLCF